ncbi:MAG TPA: Rossmann-like and DUF2520 domain-containing protein [Terriglobales bacterium]|nr:Rossmann-like and DUF2520 domain-containing protein [Terriglobales bacterium]
MIEKQHAPTSNQQSENSVILPRMAAKPSIAIVGPGSLGSALVVSLHNAGYRISEVLARENSGSRLRARRVARDVGARVVTAKNRNLLAGVVWLCVPDREIAACAQSLRNAADWKGKVALHSSGALSSDELGVLRRKGAAVASLHPMMTFVPGVSPSLEGVPFAVEGDPSAIQVARRMVRDLGGEMFAIQKRHKPAYHAWGAFASPLLISALVTAEQVAGAAGIQRESARRMMLPIVRQTLANYAHRGPAGAFSGPIVRGDAETLRKHLKILGRVPGAKEVYLALARSALKNLPARNRSLLKKVLG